MSKNIEALGRLIGGRMETVGIKESAVCSFMGSDYENIIGRRMNNASKNLDEATAAFEKATKTIFEASDELHSQMDALSKRAKDSVGRAKDMAAQMTDAMNKVTKMVGPDFDKRLAQLEQLTACLERLSALNDAGKLAPMLAAMSDNKR